MMNQNSKVGLAGAWCAGVIVLGACAIVAGVNLTIANIARQKQEADQRRESEAKARLANKAAFRP